MFLFRKRLIFIYLTFGALILNPNQILYSEVNNLEKESSIISKNETPLKDKYVIGEGDILGIKILDLPKSDIEAKVLVDGTIQIPLIGDIKVSNLTLTQAREKIEGKLKKELIRPDTFIYLVYEKPIKVVFRIG